MHICCVRMKSARISNDCKLLMLFSPRAKMGVVFMLVGASMVVL